MGFFDDLQAKAKVAMEKGLIDVQTYLTQRIVDPVVKVGPAPTGNLTAAQIEAGARGATPSIAGIQAALGDNAKYIPIIIGALGAYFLLGKRRRG